MFKSSAVKNMMPLASLAAIIISTVVSADEDPSLRIESFAIINLRGVSTKLYFKFNIHHANMDLINYLDLTLMVLERAYIGRFFFLFLASILKHMAHCFNLTHQMEYLLATGTLRSKSGLGLMQVYRFHNHEII